MPEQDKTGALGAGGENFTQNFHTGAKAIRIQVGKIAKPKLFTAGRSGRDGAPIPSPLGGEKD